MSQNKSTTYFADKIAKEIAANLAKHGAGQSITLGELKQLKKGLPNSRKITVEEVLDALLNLGLIDPSKMVITTKIEEIYLCNACGNQTHPWAPSIQRSRKIGPLFFCGQCAPMMAPSAQSTEEPVIWLATGLSRRSQDKVETLIQNLQKAWPEAPWQTIHDTAKFLREKRIKEEQERQAEIQKQREEELRQLLEVADTACAGIQGVECEIVDWRRMGSDYYLVKVGVYPGGIDFIEGTATEIKREIESMVRLSQRMRRNTFCPFCSRMLADESLYEFRCTCGAKAYPVNGRELGVPSPLCDLNWDVVRSQIKGAGPWLDEVLAARLDDAEVITGVYRVDIFGHPTYFVSPFAKVLPFEEWDVQSKIIVALSHLGFEQDIIEDNHFGHKEYAVIYKQFIEDEAVTIRLEGEEGNTTVALDDRILTKDNIHELFIEQKSSGIDNLDHFTDHIYEQWSDFCGSQEEINGWHVSDYIPLTPYDTYEGSYKTLQPPPEFNIDQMAHWLEEELQNAIQACYRVLEHFDEYLKHHTP